MVRHRKIKLCKRCAGPGGHCCIYVSIAVVVPKAMNASPSIVLNRTGFRARGNVHKGVLLGGS